MFLVFFSASSKNFIILIGGPGLYKGCDPAHDKAWNSYWNPVRILANAGLLPKKDKEHMYWFIYTPAYKRRFKDDDSSGGGYFGDTWNKLFSDPSQLYRHRNKEAERVKKTGVIDYVNYIENWAVKLSKKHKYKTSIKKISHQKHFWNELKAFPDRSISRVWYFGHASGTSFFLTLDHDDQCNPVLFNTAKEAIKKSDIGRYKRIDRLHEKFVKKPSEPSKFYACYSAAFAEEWAKQYGVPAEGAVNKIEFGVVLRAGSTPENMLQRLETSVGPPNPSTWKKFTP